MATMDFGGLNNNEFETPEEKAAFLEGRLAAEEIWGKSLETPDEKRMRELEHRIYSSNIPSGGKMSAKAKMIYKMLKQQMHKFTGSKPKQYMPPANLSWGSHSGTFNAWDEPEVQKSVLFYGFNGMLANKYSVIEGNSQEEIVARMQFAGNKIPYSIKDWNNFSIVIDQMRGTPNDLREISFDDAMNIIRIGIEKTKVEVFEDAEKDEFDDNCNVTCKPGSHTCGK